MHDDDALRIMRDAARVRGDDLLCVLVAGALGDVDAVTALVLGTDGRAWYGRMAGRSGWWQMVDPRHAAYLGASAADACVALCREALDERALLERARGGRRAALAALQVALDEDVGDALDVIGAAFAPCRR